MSDPTTQPVSYTPPCDSVSENRTAWFEQEIRVHEGEVRGYLRTHFPKVDADDVLQESYLKLLRLRATREIASAKAYFISVARNTALTLIRRRKIYSDTPVNDLPSWRVLDGGKDPAERTNTVHQHELVIEAIAQLPDRCREIVSLSAVDGLSYSEIAARLKLSESTVRVQIARGIQKITEFLRTRGEVR